MDAPTGDMTLPTVDAVTRPFPYIAITFSPAWWQAKVDRQPSAMERARLLWERFGDVGLGEEKPVLPAPVVGGEYGDRFMAAFWGGEVVYPPAAVPAALVLPDARERMAGLEVPDVATSPVAQRAFGDAERLKNEHGTCAAAVNYGGPLNNAVSVLGQDILTVCAEDPDLAREVLHKMAQGVMVVHDEIVCPINGVDPVATRAGGWGIGNCPVCMISPRMYSEVVLASDRWLSNHFTGGFYLHHCGVFDAYTEAYRPLQPLALDVGPGTDLAITRAAYPDAVISTYIEVGALSRMGLDEVDATLSEMIGAAGPPELFSAISIAEAGPEISDETVRHLMTARERFAAASCTPPTGAPDL